jgi:hypothetical protein
MTPTFSETQMETDSMQWIDAILADGEHAARLRRDLPYFAEHALKLRPKSGPLEPFILNPAQLKLHEIIEQQKAKTGRVRVIVRVAWHEIHGTTPSDRPTQTASSPAVCAHGRRCSMLT